MDGYILYELTDILDNPVKLSKRLKKTYKEEDNLKNLPQVLSTKISSGQVERINKNDNILFEKVYYTVRNIVHFIKPPTRNLVIDYSFNARYKGIVFVSKWR